MTSIKQVFSQSSKKLFNSSDVNQRYTLTDKKGQLLPLPGMTNEAGIHVSEKTALALTALYRGITLLAGSIATQPRHLFVRDADGNKMIDRAHPAYRLLKQRPNGYQNPFQFQFYMVAVMLLWGNFYAYISRNAYYEPVALHPIAPWTVDVRKENLQKVFYINGKRYSNNDIFHIYGLSLDTIKGINPIQYASQTLGTSLAAQKFQGSVFGRGLHAGGTITMPEEHKGLMGSTDEEADQYMENLRKSFKNLYQNGQDSWHELMFLEPGWQFEQFKLNLENAQLIESRKMGIADIARLLGVPLHKLMELDESSYNSVEQMGIEYVQDGVLPLSMNIEAEADYKLLKESEKDKRFFKWNLDGLMRASLKDRYEAYSIALGKNAPGWMGPEEIRDKEDLGDIDPENLYKPDNMNKQSENVNGDAA